MTHPISIRIDRLVLPASERGREHQFRSQLEAGIASRVAQQAKSAPSPDSLPDRTAAMVADQIKAAKS